MGEITASMRVAWERVARCEEGSATYGDAAWHIDGPSYSGGLGISVANWAAYGGRQFAARGALASADQQVTVARRIQANAPDQHGCAPW